MPVCNAQRLIKHIATRIRDYHQMTGLQRAEIDLSGGIDSAVVLGLVARAIGPENITTAYQGINSTVDSRNRARETASAFGVSLVELDLTDSYERLVAAMREALAVAGYPKAEIDARLDRDPTILGSIRSCLRAPVGRGLNRMTGGGLRHGTGNEDEDRFMRFYQKGGDGEVDSNPISMLSKGEVFQIARALGVPLSVLKARPSPDLWGVGEDHNDEDEILAALGIKGQTGGVTAYSYIDLTTGEYTSVGLIERLSRFLDSLVRIGADAQPMGVRTLMTGEKALFGLDLEASPAVRDMVITAVVEHPNFLGIDPEVVGRFALAARRMERVTRHKLNPNIPAFSTRAELVESDILTNDLPL